MSHQEQQQRGIPKGRVALYIVANAVVVLWIGHAIFSPDYRGPTHAHAQTQATQPNCKPQRVQIACDCDECLDIECEQYLEDNYGHHGKQLLQCTLPAEAEAMYYGCGKLAHEDTGGKCNYEDRLRLVFKKPIDNTNYLTAVGIYCATLSARAASTGSACLD